MPYRKPYRSHVALVRILTLFLLTCLTPLVASRAQAQDTVATLFSLEGQAQKREHGGTWTACAQGASFATGDEIRVAEASRAGIQFSSGLFIRLSAGSSLTFTPQATGVGLHVENGEAHFFNRQGGALPTIQTSVVTAAIRGTEFIIIAAPKQSTIAVIEGQVEASNKFGAVVLNPGEQSLTREGSAPQKPLHFSVTDAVQWTAEIPVQFDWDEMTATLNSKEDRELLARVKAATSARSIAGALKLTANKGSESSPATLRLLRAKLLMSVGDVAQSSALLKCESCFGAPGSHERAERDALVSLTALSHNDLMTAKELAERASASNATSPQVAWAASIVAQGEKNLEKARDSIAAALKVHPHNAELLARMAELQLGEGDTDAADRSVTSALESDPNSGYALSVKGFVHLTKNQPEQAARVFTEATAASPGSGLPFLGLGLAKISTGDVQAGQTEIARAVHLEPTRAVFRSYLGKAFFELEREEAALREYGEAIRLDPNDPTAWLYRGFANLSKNRPVNALRDLERSDELNGARGVYRSSLLLDQDSAVRSAGLSRMFTELGFGERGRLEAVRALDNDMSNFSAHRLLAESQNEIFFADASFSERRVADLLSPLSFNLFSTLGGKASLNEYDALFDKSERRTALSVEYDERNDSFNSDISYSGKSERVGYAMAASNSYGGGRTSYNYLRDYRLDGALRFQLAPEHRLLLDGHGIFNKSRDFGAETQDSEFALGGGGIGYSYQIDAANTLLAEATLSRDRLKSGSFDAARTVDSTQIFEGERDTISDDLLLDQLTKEYVTAERGGAQFIHHGQLLSWVGGFQVLHESPKRFEDSLITDDSLGELTDQGLTLASEGHKELTGADVYLYPTLHASSWLDLTAGVTRSDLEIEDREVAPFASSRHSAGHFSPKAGFSARPFKDFALRGAYFESLHKSSLEDQVSIEPTLVSGITQRFNDLSGTESRNFGIGGDYKFGRNTYLGAEYIRRFLNEPGMFAGNEIITNIDTQEQYGIVQLGDRYDTHVKQDFVRAYLYQVLSESWVASFDYRYGTDQVTDPDAYTNFLMHRASAQLKYFHPCGAFAFARATWRKQQGINDPLIDGGRDTALVFDAGIGYRLPRRRGTLVLEALNLNNEHFSFDQSHGFEDAVKPDFGLRAVATVNF